MPADSPNPALLSDEQIAEIKADIEAGPYQYCTLENANRLISHALAASAALAEREGEIAALRASKEKLHRRAQAAEGPLEAVKAHGAEAYKQWVQSWHFEFKRFLAEKALREAAEATIARQAAEIAELKGLLSELVAMVRGECPSILDEDSGGSARLSMDIDAALGNAETGR